MYASFSTPSESPARLVPQGVQHPDAALASADENAELDRDVLFFFDRASGFRVAVPGRPRIASTARPAPEACTELVLDGAPCRVVIRTERHPTASIPAAALAPAAARMRVSGATSVGCMQNNIERVLLASTPTHLVEVRISYPEPAEASESVQLVLAIIEDSVQVERVRALEVGAEKPRAVWPHSRLIEPGLRGHLSAFSQSFLPGFTAALDVQEIARPALTRAIEASVQGGRAPRHVLEERERVQMWECLYLACTSSAYREILTAVFSCVRTQQDARGLAKLLALACARAWSKPADATGPMSVPSLQELVPPSDDAGA